MNDCTKRLEEQLAEMKRINASLTAILNSNTNTTCDVDKSIVFQNANVVVQLTSMHDKSYSQARGTAFDSDIVLLDGELIVEDSGKMEKLTKKKRMYNLPKGSIAKGTSVGQSHVITIIDIDENTQP